MSRQFHEAMDRLDRIEAADPQFRCDDPVKRERKERDWHEKGQCGEEAMRT